MITVQLTNSFFKPYLLYAEALKSQDLTSRDLTTRHHVHFSDFAFPVCYALMSRKTTELYVKVFQRVQQLVPQFAPTCAMEDSEEVSVAGFFLDNRLCQITVQTFSCSALLLLRFHPLTHTCAVDGVCSWIIYDSITIWLCFNQCVTLFH